jgi:TolA protein
LAWSQSRSSGNRPTGSPFFPELPPPPLRALIALSAMAHVALVVAALAVGPLLVTPLRLEPVAVVDLIGGGEFRQEPAKPEAPAAREDTAVREDTKPAPRDRTAPARLPAEREKRAKAASDDVVPSKRKTADTASLTERLREMREARAGSEAVRGAVEERRSETAARAAVRKVGERVAHRIESPPQPSRSGGRGAAGAGGSQGTVRLSPELLDYFRRLEEKVRSSWVLPGTLVRDAAKLVVELRIVIEKDGRVSEERIEQGSGNPYFDDSVLRAIRKASPLPVPPEQLRGGEDHYEIGFRFHGGAG